MPTAASLYYFSHPGEAFAHEGEDPTNTPIILIHGAGGSHLHFPPELRRLNGFQVAALDLPGHGKSEGVGRQTISEYVQVVQDFMDAINLPAAVIIGHSMGSAIALVILGGGSRLGVAPSILESTANEATFPLAIKTIVDLSYGSQASDRLKELATQRMQETRPTVLNGDFIACNEFNAREGLAEIKVSTLILCGTEDKMTPPKYSKQLDEHIPNSELALIEGAGHMVMLEKPRDVAEVIERFVEKL